MLNGNDLELLSAYLDGALNDGERAALEARLQTDAELRRELARLRATVELVKTLPTLSAPRDFTLKPGMARRRPSIVTSAAFSALSSAAAIILLVIGVSLFSRGAFAPSGLRDEVAFAPTTALRAEAGEAAVSTTGEAIVLAPATTLEEDVDSVANGVLPSVANSLPVPSTQKLDTQEAQNLNDQFMAFATGTPMAQPTLAPPSMEILRFAAEPSNEVSGETPSDTQSRVDTETESAGDDSAALSQEAVDASTGLTQQNAPAVSGAAAAQAPLPAPTMLPTSKPTNTSTLTPSPAPTTTLAPTLTLPPTETVTPLPLATLLSPAQPIQPAQDTNTVGIGLIVAALGLFGVAIVTTLLRRRG